VSCSPRKWGARKWSECIDRNNKVAISRILSSMNPDPNGTKFTVEMPSTQGRTHSKFEEDSFSCSWDTSYQTFKKYSSFFLLLFAHFYNSCMRASIWLKFSTRVGGLKANTLIKFWIILINIWGVTSNFMYKTKSKFCQAYRVNRFEEHTKNWYVARLNIRGVPFGG